MFTETPNKTTRKILPNIPNRGEAIEVDLQEIKVKLIKLHFVLNTIKRHIDHEGQFRVDVNLISPLFHDKISAFVLSTKILVDQNHKRLLYSNNYQRKQLFLKIENLVNELIAFDNRISTADVSSSLSHTKSHVEISREANTEPNYRFPKGYIDMGKMGDLYKNLIDSILPQIDTVNRNIDFELQSFHKKGRNVDDM